MKRIYFNEVAPRDGFQIEPEFVPTDAKVALIDALSACGYAKIEATSFTSPKAIPMLRDAVHMLDTMGYDTGMDLARLLAVANTLPAIVGHAVLGQVAKAGTRLTLHPAPAYVAELRASIP
jgi:isopropylmalate/homocitrate/citramalate synthase